MTEDRNDTGTTAPDWLEAVAWNTDGLVPVVTQEAATGRVLMLAWMNRAALAETARSGYAVYWSRSRRRLWRKGESSGHHQRVREIRLDCDGDTVLLVVEQAGGIACHTGRAHCFYRLLQGDEWQTVEPVLKPPAALYGENNDD